MKKIIAVMLSVLMFISSAGSAVAGDENNREKFEKAHQQMAEAKSFLGLDKEDILFACELGAIAGVITLIMKEGSPFYRVVKEYNAVTEQLREIGLPKNLAELTNDTEARELVNSIKQFEENFDRLVDVHNGDVVIYNTPVSGREYTKIKENMFTRAEKAVDVYKKEVLARAAKFKKAHPELLYTHEYTEFIPDSFNYFKNDWNLATVRTDEVSVRNGIVASGKYKGMQVEQRNLDNYFFIRLNKHNKALHRQALKKGLGKGVGAGAVMVGIGLILEGTTQTVSAKDKTIADRLRANPQLVIDMSDEEANLIGTHANELPETIDLYSQYAQAISEFVQLSQEEQEAVLEEAKNMKRQNSIVHENVTRSLRSISAH